MKKLLPFALALSAAATLSLPAHAVTVVQWDFEGTTTPADLSNSTNSPTVAASTGTGTASGWHVSAATDWTTPAGNGSANALSSNTWAADDYYQFSFATTGYADLVLSFDQTRSSTGPSGFSLVYSTDGGSSFTSFGSYTVAQVTWSSGSTASGSSYSFDLSALSALDNKSSVVLRLVNSSTVATGGTNRIDNVTVAMAPVPEPETYALMLAGLGAIGLMARRRRQGA